MKNSKIIPILCYLSIQIAYSQLAITRLDPFGNSIVVSSGTEQYIGDELIIKFKDSVLTKDFFIPKRRKSSYIH